MPRSSIIRPYRWLAQYYDELLSSFRGPIDAAREHILGRILPMSKPPAIWRVARERRR